MLKVAESRLEQQNRANGDDADDLVTLGDAAVLTSLTQYEGEDKPGSDHNGDKRVRGPVQSV